MPCGTVSFERRALKNFPKWDRSPCTLCGFHIRADGMIETEGAGMLQVRFVLVSKVMLPSSLLTTSLTKACWNFIRRLYFNILRFEVDKQLQL